MRALCNDSSRTKWQREELKVLEVIETMPEKSSIDQLMERLIFIQEVEDSRKGRVYS